MSLDLPLISLMYHQSETIRTTVIFHIFKVAGLVMINDEVWDIRQYWVIQGWGKNRQKYIVSIKSIIS